MGSTNSIFTVTVYNINGCSYSENYTVLTSGNLSLNGVTNVGFSYITSTLCSDTSTWFYLTNPTSNPPNQPILEIGANDSVILEGIL